MDTTTSNPGETNMSANSERRWEIDADRVDFAEFLKWIKTSPSPNVYIAFRSKAKKAKCFFEPKVKAPTLNAPTGQMLIDAIVKSIRDELARGTGNLDEWVNYLKDNRVKFRKKNPNSPASPFGLAGAAKTRLQEMKAWIDSNPTGEESLTQLIKVNKLAKDLEQFKENLKSCRNHIDEFNPPQGKLIEESLPTLLNLTKAFENVSSWAKKCLKESDIDSTTLDEYLKPCLDISNLSAVRDQYIEEIDTYNKSKMLDPHFEGFLKSIWIDQIEIEKELAPLCEGKYLQLFLQVFSRKDSESKGAIKNLADRWEKAYAEKSARRATLNTLSDDKSKTLEIDIRRIVAMLMSFYRCNFIENNLERNELIRRLFLRNESPDYIKSVADIIDDKTLINCEFKPGLSLAEWESFFPTRNANDFSQYVQRFTNASISLPKINEICKAVNLIRKNEEGKYRWAWAAALTSKLAFFLVPNMRHVDEPRSIKVKHIKYVLLNRIEDAVKHIWNGRSLHCGAQETQLYEKTEEYFSIHAKDDEFKSIAYQKRTEGIKISHDFPWMFGKQFSDFVSSMKNKDESFSGDIGDYLVILFCKPLNLIRDGDRLVQIFLQLEKIDEHFRTHLLIPLSRHKASIDNSQSIYFARINVAGEIL